MMCLRSHFFVFFFFFFCIENNSIQAALRLLSLGAGSVKGETFTSREVHIHYIIEKVLFSRSLKFPKKLDIQDPLFLAQVDSFLIEQAVYLEMRNFSKLEISKHEFQQNVKKMELLSHPYWLEQRVTLRELRHMLRKKMSAKKFINARAEASAIPVTKKEIHEYFMKHKQKFGNISFRKLQKQISNHLVQKQLNERLSEWFQVLHKKYKIQNFLRNL